MSDQTCNVSDEELMAFVCGDLAGDVEMEIAMHLGTCPACREQTAEYMNVCGAITSCCQKDDAVRWHRFRTPFGTTYAAATDKGISRISWRQPGPSAFERYLSTRFPGRPVIHDGEALEEAERQLVEYFEGDRAEFELPVDLSLVTEFERRVLEAARKIPYGQVVPYAELARRIRKPGASRAVGNALGHNPVAIVVPCHRVVRSDGSLGGYTGGVEYKEKLLEIEGMRDLFSMS